jgi:basic membrane lipoprotein Med (substrate-binding protein (PBP1-ABC) superfamily)
MDQGADVIQSAAGPTGSAAVLAFTRAGRWGFGVDQDEWVSTYGSGAEPSSRFLLGSAVKRVDVAVEAILLEVAADMFESGTRLFDAAINGVGVAPCHDSCEFYTEEVVEREADAVARLQDGVTSTGYTSLLRLLLFDSCVGVGVGAGVWLLTSDSYAYNNALDQHAT